MRSKRVRYINIFRWILPFFFLLRNQASQKYYWSIRSRTQRLQHFRTLVSYFGITEIYIKLKTASIFSIEDSNWRMVQNMNLWCSFASFWHLQAQRFDFQFNNLYLIFTACNSMSFEMLSLWSNLYMCALFLLDLMWIEPNGQWAGLLAS